MSYLCFFHNCISSQWAWWLRLNVISVHLCWVQCLWYNENLYSPFTINSRPIFSASIGILLCRRQALSCTNCVQSNRLSVRRLIFSSLFVNNITQHPFRGRPRLVFPDMLQFTAVFKSSFFPRMCPVHALFLFEVMQTRHRFSSALSNTSSLPPRKEEVNVFCPCLSVCLSVSKITKNACMNLDEMLHVDRCRDIDELINF